MAAAAEPVRGAEASDVGRDGHQHTSMVTSGMAFPSPSTSIQQTSPIPLRCRIGSVGPRASSGANRLPPDCRSSTAGRHGCRRRSPRRSRRARCVARRTGWGRPRSDRRKASVECSAQLKEVGGLALVSPSYRDQDWGQPCGVWGNADDRGGAALVPHLLHSR